MSTPDSPVPSRMLPFELVMVTANVGPESAAVVVTGESIMLSEAVRLILPVALDVDAEVTAPLVAEPITNDPVAVTVALPSDWKETVGFPVSDRETAPAVDTSSITDESDGPGSVFLRLIPEVADALMASRLVISGADDGVNAPIVPPALRDADPDESVTSTPV